MDPKRFREAYTKLQLLDERLTYKLKPRAMGAARASVEQVEDRVRDLSAFAIELKEILEALFVAIGSKPQTGGETEPGAPAATE
ncbi:MAG TPA: hypothetical protein VMT85_05860 [Thermoanaerobaculia bacterium]|nr:hypothetical protein [Thermoanaerobaculia bacterium]